MIAMVLIGALVGASIFALVLQVLPPKDSALVALGRFDARTNPEPSLSSGVGAPEQTGGVAGWLGARIVRELRRRGWESASLRQDLTLAGKSFEATMGRKVIYAATGALVGLLVIVSATLELGVAFPPGTPLVAAGLAGATAFFLPDAAARTQAGRRRVDFRRALGAYLDLVALEMAGSAAPAEALPAAARVGSGWPVALLRDTLYRATRSGKDQWVALTELGVRIGVAELRDLGQMVQLVSHDGARVRATLMARSATMRRRELADLVGQAGKRDQSMRMAQVLLGVGFMLFLGYPAFVAVLNF